MTFQIGDTVQLAGGGPPMQVVGLLEFPFERVGCALLPLDAVRQDFSWRDPSELQKV